MKKSRTLLTYHDLTVEVEMTPNEELMEHMHQTVLGQPGGFRYQHTNLEERFYSGDENYFLYLRKSGKMKADQPAIVFAIIDQTNLRSMNFSAQMGLETVGSIAGFSFSRMQPRRSERIETVKESERAVILKQIGEYYKDYTLFYSDSVFKNNDYYVIKEGGRMVAGVLESTGHYIAMMMMDLDSGLYSLFRDRKKLGILNKIMGTFYADIRVRFIHMPDAVREQFYNRPTYIPTYDNS